MNHIMLCNSKIKRRPLLFANSDMGQFFNVFFCLVCEGVKDKDQRRHQSKLNWTQFTRDQF